MEDLRVCIRARLATLDQKRAELVRFRGFMHSFGFGIESADQSLIFNHDHFAGILPDQFILMREIITEFRLEGNRRVHCGDRLHPPSVDSR